MFINFNVFFKKGLFICFLLVLSYSATNAQMKQAYLDTEASNEIYKISFYSASAGYVAFQNWLGYTTDTGKTFTKKYITSSNVNYNGYSVNLTFGFTINGVKAFSQNTILAYGDYGFVPAILYSTNGGTSFTLVYHSQYNPLQFKTGITDMIFSQGSSIGYAIDADRILKTINGGLTWQQNATVADSYFTNLEAPDNQNVFAISPQTGRILKTNDGGTNWALQNLPVLNEAKIGCANFLTATTGWLNMYDNNNNKGYIFKTINGGSSWQLQNNIDATAFVFNKMKFVDVNTGYGLSYQNTIYKTTDGGVIWEPLPRDNNYAYFFYSHKDLYFFNANQFWVGGAHGFLEYTTNTGGTPLPKAYFRIDTAGMSLNNKINLVNFSKTGYQYRWYLNDVIISTNYNSFYTHSVTNSTDSIKLVVTNGNEIDSLTKYQYFVIPNLPVISSFTPTTGSTGTFITITGNRFGAVIAVKIGGVSVESFTIISNNTITATIANGSTGAVSVTDINGTASLSGFTYFATSSFPPVITSISPSSGSVGTAVTISGDNFNTTSTNNNVYFGSVRALVSSSTKNKIVCIVPVGASFKPVSVLNKSTGLSAQSLKPFNFTFSDSSYFTRGSFSLAYNTELSPSLVNYARYVKGEDVDGDGKPDILCSYSGMYQPLGVFRNISEGSNFLFDPMTEISNKFNSGIDNFDFGDLDGDGRSEIVGISRVTFENIPQVLILKNTSTIGSISFNTQVILPVNTYSQNVKIADFDNDGKNDIVVASNKNLDIIRNTSSPGFLSFGSTINIPQPTFAAYADAIIGDLNGDGKKDLIAYFIFNSGVVDIFVYLNISTTGNIAFALQPGIIPSSFNVNTNSMQFADIDNDNKLDLVILTSNDLHILKNESTLDKISFATPKVFTNKQADSKLLIANFSGDSKPDLLSYSSYGATNSLFSFYRNGTIGGDIFFEKGIINSLNRCIDNATADFNMDGKIDIICINDRFPQYNEHLNIYSNTVGGFIKDRACAGTTKTITADLTGTQYQWQQDKGAGFVNLTDSANISGVNEQTLTISTIPFSWSGYKFRCVFDSFYSTTTRVNVIPANPPAKIQISATADTICYGTYAYFTSSINAIGSTINYYDWLVNGNRVFNFGESFYPGSLKNNDKVTCVLSTSDSCGNVFTDTSNIIVITVYAEPNSVTISTPSTSFCKGTPVVFRASSIYPQIPFIWVVDGVIQTDSTSSSFTTSNLGNLSTVYFYQSLGGGLCYANSEIIRMNETANCPCIYNQWLGTVSNVWENTANWSCGTIPNASSIAVINIGNVSVNSNAIVYSLILGTGANFTVNPGFNLTILK